MTAAGMAPFTADEAASRAMAVRCKGRWMVGACPVEQRHELLRLVRDYRLAAAPDGETLELPPRGWSPAWLAPRDVRQAEELVRAAVACGAITAVRGYGIRLAAAADADGQAVGQWIVSLPGLPTNVATALARFTDPELAGWADPGDTVATVVDLIRRAAADGNQLAAAVREWKELPWPARCH